MRSVRTRLPAVAIAITIAELIGCKSSQQKRPTPAAPVRVVPAARIDAPINLLASGIVEPVQTVAVTAQVSGSLLDVLFNEGDFVQAGQVLFRIDPRPMRAAVDQARAALARDEAQAEAGRRDDVRYRTLANMGYVSRSQADQIHATAMAQEATVRADEAVVRAAEVNLGFTTIRAPIAGRTGGLLVRKGNNVSGGSGPLVVINQISPVLVRFPVLEQDFQRVQMAVAAHPLLVTASASDSAQTTERGQLRFLDNAVDSLTGTVTGKAEFPNPARRLWPGELVYLTIQVNVLPGVIAVPTEALQTGQQGIYVWVVDVKNSARERPVVAGPQVGDLTVVQSGLAAGERVVVDGQSRLNPGSRVAIINTGTDTGTARLGMGAAATGSGPASASSANIGTAGGEIVTGYPGGAGGSATPANGAAGGVGRGGAGASSTIGSSPASTGAGAARAGAAASSAAPAVAPPALPAVTPAPTLPNGSTGSSTTGTTNRTTPSATSTTPGATRPPATASPTTSPASRAPGRPPAGTTP